MQGRNLLMYKQITIVILTKTAETTTATIKNINKMHLFLQNSFNLSI
jgi:hypothetical protein